MRKRVGAVAVSQLEILPKQHLERRLFGASCLRRPREQTIRLCAARAV